MKMQDSTHLENQGNEGGEPEQVPEFTNAEKALLKAYEMAACNMSEACRMSGYTRQWFHKLLVRNPHFKAAVEALDEEDLDFAESELRRKIRGQFVYIKKLDKDGNPIPKKDLNGKIIPNEFELELDALGEPLRDYKIPVDTTALIFKLKTKGKKRGYTYRTEITGADGSAIGGYEINILGGKRQPKQQ